MSNASSGSRAGLQSAGTCTDHTLGTSFIPSRVATIENNLWLSPRHWGERTRKKVAFPSGLQLRQNEARIEINNLFCLMFEFRQAALNDQRALSAIIHCGLEG
jgi:hypothetical protein